ncbi:MAG: DUF2298 domain-containing protein [Microgenomates group bacterium]
MFLTDFNYIFFWWLVYFVFGMAGLPLTFYFFGKFWDKGYIFAKTIGLVITTFFILVFGIFKLIPFSSVSVVFLMMATALIGLILLKQKNTLNTFNSIIRTHWKIFLFEEIIFLLILTLWSYIRGFAPDIEGLEKFMDWGFVNSALRSQFMPPLDMWFSGFPINYYYFGHLEIAVLAKISTLDSAIVYNLAIASTCALTFVNSFSLVSNLIAKSLSKINLRLVVLGGLLSSLLLTFGGNLHPLYKIGANIIKNESRLIINQKTLTQASSSYWYPDATRFIGFDPDVPDKTIHEFPLYSFVVADLHGHMNDIPNILLFMAVLLSLFLFNSIQSFSWVLILPSAFLLSVAYMTNAWDFAVYGLLYGIFSVLSLWNSHNFRQAIIVTTINGLLVIVCWYIFTIPFSLNFSPMTEGLRLSDSHSPFYQLFVLYGGFWLIALPFILLAIKKMFFHHFSLITDHFILALIITATILIIIPEVGYIKDIYIFEHRRANTMFKLVYQAFILYSLVSGYILVKFRQNLFAKIIIILVMASHLIYPFFAIKGYYPLTEYKGIWGLNFLKNNYPDNLTAINWLNKNISGQPVILEAVGDSYTTFNQVSMATGLPTVEGWIVHEWLWRGGYDQPSARQNDVQKIYESSDPTEVRSLLQKYSVEYIFVGDKEREKYSTLDEKMFENIGAKSVFQSGQTKVYKIF